MYKYEIVRMYRERGKKARRTGVKYETLEEAQEHCKREDTHGDGWFDGYQEIN